MPPSVPSDPAKRSFGTEVGIAFATELTMAAGKGGVDEQRADLYSGPRQSRQKIHAQGPTGFSIFSHRCCLRGNNEYLTHKCQH